jgi:hypothetical protein
MQEFGFSKVAVQLLRRLAKHQWQRRMEGECRAPRIIGFDTRWEASGVPSHTGNRAPA